MPGRAADTIMAFQYTIPPHPVFGFATASDLFEYFPQHLVHELSIEAKHDELRRSQ